MRALLDVNVLIALLDENHIHHAAASDWLAERDDVSLLDDAVVDRRRLSGPRQVTDVYLPALAVALGARMVTLDKSVPLSAVPGASEGSLVAI